MAEYRVHWEQDGEIRFKWFRARGPAIDFICELRRDLGSPGADICADKNIVKFELSAATKGSLLDFLNEHVCTLTSASP